MSSWEKFVKKYVWDEQTTPFLVSVGRLHRRQADKELFLFVLFLGTPFALVLLGAALRLPQEFTLGRVAAAAYALSVLVALSVLGARRHWLAAAYCLTAPLAILLHFVVDGFPSRMQALDQTIVLVMLIAWLRYTFRVVEIARAYERLPPPPDRG